MRGDMFLIGRNNIVWFIQTTHSGRNSR